MSGDGELLGIEKRTALLGLALALALTLAAIAVIGEVTSYARLASAWRQANKGWLPLCLVGELVAYLGYLAAYRSVAAADGGPKLRYRDAGQVITLGMGAYVLGSGAGGLAVDFWAMRKAGAATHQAARRTLALNTLEAAALTWMAVLAGVVVLIRGAQPAAISMALVWLCVVPVATTAAYALSGPGIAPGLLRAPEAGERPRIRLVAAWARWVGAKLRKVFADAIGGVVFVRHVLAHPRRYLGGLVGYPLFWLGDFLVLWIALRAFGVELGPDRLVVAEATAWTLSFLPLPGGGAGAAEATIAYTLHAVGVPLSTALFAAVAYRVVNFWLPIVPALALLPRVPRLEESLRRSEHTGRDADASLHGDEGTRAARKAA